MDLIDISVQNLNVNTFTYNYLNVVFDNLNARNLEIKANVIKLVNTVNTDLIVLFVLIFFISLISLWIFSFLITAIKTEREAILFLFLDINQSYVQVLYRKCDNFLSAYVVIKNYKWPFFYKLKLTKTSLYILILLFLLLIKSMKTLIEEYEDEDIYESSSEENDQEANLVYLNNDLEEKEDEEENERNIKLKKSTIKSLNPNTFI